MDTSPAILQLGPMARRLRVTVGWLRAEAEAGRVPCVRAGDRFLFSPAAVEAVLARRAATATIVDLGVGPLPQL